MEYTIILILNKRASPRLLLDRTHHYNFNMERVNSPFFILSLLLLYSCLSFATTHQINTDDESALLAFKSLITSDPHKILKNNWTTGTSICTWKGVTCDSSNSRVTHLHLNYKRLKGCITPEIGNLSFLVSLDLSENYFHGTVPKDICRYNNLPRLEELQLSRNNLEGEIPVSLVECPQLEILDLSTNNFSGHAYTNWEHHTP